jgi:hypothetical protein
VDAEFTGGIAASLGFALPVVVALQPFNSIRRSSSVTEKFGGRNAATEARFK